jgi:hypothetical protein
MGPTSSLPRMLAAVLFGALVASAASARAQDPDALAKVKDLNKKAVEAYEGLDMEEARKFLMQALEVCAAEGLNKHPLKATTHVNLGVVLIGGFKQRDGGMKQFRRALEIEPGVRIAKRLNNPEIQSAFDGAKEALVNEPAPGEPAAPEPKLTPKPDVVAGPASPPEPPPAPKPAADGPPADIKGIFHEPVTEAKPGNNIALKAAVESSLAFEHLVLAYRPEGALDFLQREMSKQDSGWYTARIPEPATVRASVAYYIEARGKGGQAVASNGTAAEPHQISLGGSIVGGRGDEPGSGRDKGGSRYWVSIGVGGGYGYAKGNPEVTPRWVKSNGTKQDIEFSGLAPATLMHVVPEIGYFLSPTLILSVQARLQVVTGATEVYDNACTGKVCKPAPGAVAVLAKATWLFGENGGLRPYFSLAAGGGQVRHLVSVPLSDCGAAKNQDCVDTVVGGPLLLGPSVGIAYPLGSTMFLNASLNTLAGLPNVQINADLNIGLAMKL